MPAVAIVPASPAHIGAIANRMRVADRIECAAMGHTPKHALRLGVRGSSLCFTAMVDGVAQAMFGLVVTSALSGQGTPWMLGSDAIYDHPRAMLRLGRRFIAAVADSTPHLSNLVAADNPRAIRYLQALGFIVEEQQIVHNGVAFRVFAQDLR